MGLLLDMDTMTLDQIESTIREVLSNPEYKRNAEVTKRLLNDHQVEPKQQFLFWIKYIIRTDGAKHLIHEFAQEMSLVEFWSLDVYFVVVLTVILALTFTCIFMYYIFKVLGRFWRSKEKLE